MPHGHILEFLAKYADCKYKINLLYDENEGVSFPKSDRDRYTDVFDMV